MKKEVFIAIIVGFILGLIITYGIYTARRSLSQPPSIDNPSLTTSISPTPETTGSHTLNLTSPSNFSVIDQDHVQITGITTPLSLISAVTTDSEVLGSADDQGNLSIDISLSAGENLISLSSYTTTGEVASSNLNLIYTTAPLSSDNQL